MKSTFKSMPLLAAFFVLVLLPACQKEAPVEEPPVEEPEETLTNDDITNCSIAAVKLELEREAIEGLHKEQITECYSLDETEYAFVSQPNAWTVLQEVRDWEAEGNEAWSGLLKREAGKDWEIFFEIPEENFNPVGFYLREEDLVLDVADDSGAGSGEGTLLRYSYPFAGVSEENLQQWAKEKCDGYYIPETYAKENEACT